MSSYIRLVFISFILTLNVYSSSTSNDKEGTLVLIALDYELKKDILHSSVIYTKLYKLTNKLEYFKKAIHQNYLSKHYNTVISLYENNLNKFPKDNELFYRLVVASYLYEKKLSKSLKIALQLLAKYNNSDNYELVAKIYYYIGNYQKANDYFESAYATNKKTSTLVIMADILYSYLDQKKKALSYLETDIQLNGCSKEVCNKLLTFYQEEQNIDGIISISKKVLKIYTNKIEKLIIKKLLVSALEKKDINLAIQYLEKEHIDDIKLLSLYGRTNQSKKALSLLIRKYKQTKNKLILGQIAILRYEMAKDKKDVMEHVIANFELAIQATNSANFKNYYGYLLIDENINIKKGLKLVLEALDKSPNNLAYMDSVAWGYYKLKQCKQAKKYMKIITDKTGLSNKEIKLHFNKIQECGK